MSNRLFEQLYHEGLVSKESLDRSAGLYTAPRISLQKDLKVLLYAGVLLLSSGLSILVYKHIDSIGHIAVLSFIGIICTFCYVYCYRKSSPFSWTEVNSPDAFFDYLAVLGGLLLVTFIAYLQYRYRIFGENWNLAALISAILLFLTAYYFDQQSVLSLAIVNLGAWLGIIVNRLRWPFIFILNEDISIYTAIILGVMLILISFLSVKTRLKPHFKNIYHQFGTHIFFIATIYAIFYFTPVYWPWLILLLLGVCYQIIKASRESSFYYLLVAIIYMYIGVSYWVIDLLTHTVTKSNLQTKYILIYFIISATSLVFLLVRVNNKFKRNAGI